jgi:hypothetical protein
MARGDHIYCNRLRGVYNHHGIDCGDGSVIHFGAPDWQTPRQIQRVELEDFRRGDELQVRDYTEFFDTVEQGRNTSDLVTRASRRLNRLFDSLRGLALEQLDFSSDAVIARAESRLGEGNFHLLFNNCEHFASWCVTGISNSNQVDAIWRASLTPAQFMRLRTEHFLTEAFEYDWLRRR